MQTLNQRNDTNRRTGMIVKRVSVPIGLEELMEGLSKEVILRQPKDLYLFASEYFAKLINLREKSTTYKAHPVHTMQSVTKLKNIDVPPLKKISPARPVKHLSRQLSIRSKSPKHQIPTQTESITKKKVASKSGERRISTDRRDSTARGNAKTVPPRDLKGGTSTDTSVQSTPRDKRRTSVTRKLKSSVSDDHTKARVENKKILRQPKRAKSEKVKTALISPIVIGETIKATNRSLSDKGIPQENEKNHLLDSDILTENSKIYSISNQVKSHDVEQTENKEVKKHTTNIMELEDTSNVSTSKSSDKSLDSDILAQSTNIAEISKNIHRSDEKPESAEISKNIVTYSTIVNNEKRESSNVSSVETGDENLEKDRKVDKKDDIVQNETSNNNDTGINKTKQNLELTDNNNGSDVFPKSVKELHDNISTNELSDADNNQDIESMSQDAIDLVQNIKGEAAVEGSTNTSKLPVENVDNVVDNINILEGKDQGSTIEKLGISKILETDYDEGKTIQESNENGGNKPSVVQKEITEKSDDMSPNQVISETERIASENKEISDNIKSDTLTTSGEPDNSLTKASKIQGSDTKEQVTLQETLNHAETLVGPASTLLAHEESRKENNLKSASKKTNKNEVTDDAVSNNEQSESVKTNSSTYENMDDKVTIKLENMDQSNDLLTVSILDHIGTANIDGKDDKISQVDDDNKTLESMENVNPTNSTDEVPQKENQFFRKNEELVSKEDDKSKISIPNSGGESIKDLHYEQERSSIGKSSKVDRPHGNASTDLEKYIELENPDLSQQIDSNSQEEILKNKKSIPADADKDDRIVGEPHETNLNADRNNLNTGSNVTQNIINYEISKNQPGIIDSPVKQFLNSFLNNEQLNVFKSKEGQKENNELENKIELEKADEHIGNKGNELLNENKEIALKNNDNLKDNLPAEVKVYSGSPLTFSSVKDLLDFDPNNSSNNVNETQSTRGRIDTEQASPEGSTIVSIPHDMAGSTDDNKQYHIEEHDDEQLSKVEKSVNAETVDQRKSETENLQMRNKNLDEDIAEKNSKEIQFSENKMFPSSSSTINERENESTILNETNIQKEIKENVSKTSFSKEDYSDLKATKTTTESDNIILNRECPESSIMNIKAEKAMISKDNSSALEGTKTVTESDEKILNSKNPENSVMNIKIDESTISKENSSDLEVTKTAAESGNKILIIENAMRNAADEINTVKENTNELDIDKINERKVTSQMSGLQNLNNLGTKTTDADKNKDSEKNGNLKVTELGEIAASIDVIRNIMSSKISVHKPGVLDTSVSKYLHSFLSNEQSNVFQNIPADQSKSASLIKNQINITKEGSTLNSSKVPNNSIESKEPKVKSNKSLIKKRRSQSQENVLSMEKKLPETATKNSKLRRVRSVGVIKHLENEQKSKIPTSARRSAGRRPLVRQLETDSKDIEEKLSNEKEFTKSSQGISPRGNKEGHKRPSEDSKDMTVTTGKHPEQAKSNKFGNKYKEEKLSLLEKDINKEVSKDLKDTEEKHFKDTETSKILDKDNIKISLLENDINKIVSKDVVTKEDVLIAKKILKGIEGAEKHIELIEGKISPNAKNTFEVDSNKDKNKQPTEDGINNVSANVKSEIIDKIKEETKDDMEDKKSKSKTDNVNGQKEYISDVGRLEPLLSKKINEIHSKNLSNTDGSEVPIASGKPLSDNLLEQTLMADKIVGSKSVAVSVTGHKDDISDVGRDESTLSKEIVHSKKLSNIDGSEVPIDPGKLLSDDLLDRTLMADRIIGSVANNDNMEDIKSKSVTDSVPGQKEDISDADPVKSTLSKEINEIQSRNFPNTDGSEVSIYPDIPLSDNRLDKTLMADNKILGNVADNDNIEDIKNKSVADSVTDQKEDISDAGRVDSTLSKEINELHSKNFSTTDESAVSIDPDKLLSDKLLDKTLMADKIVGTVVDNDDIEDIKSKSVADSVTDQEEDISDVGRVKSTLSKEIVHSKNLSTTDEFKVPIDPDKSISDNLLDKTLMADKIVGSVAGNDNIEDIKSKSVADSVTDQKEDISNAGRVESTLSKEINELHSKNLSITDESKVPIEPDKLISDNLLDKRLMADKIVGSVAGNDHIEDIKSKSVADSVTDQKENISNAGRVESTLSKEINELHSKNLSITDESKVPIEPDKLISDNLLDKRLMADKIVGSVAGNDHIEDIKSKSVADSVTDQKENISNAGRVESTLSKKINELHSKNLSITDESKVPIEPDKLISDNLLDKTLMADKIVGIVAGNDNIEDIKSKSVADSVTDQKEDISNVGRVESTLSKEINELHSKNLSTTDEFKVPIDPDKPISDNLLDDTHMADKIVGSVKGNDIEDIKSKNVADSITNQIEDISDTGRVESTLSKEINQIHSKNLPNTDGSDVPIDPGKSLSDNLLERTLMSDEIVGSIADIDNIEDINSKSIADSIAGHKEDISDVGRVKPTLSKEIVHSKNLSNTDGSEVAINPGKPLSDNLLDRTRMADKIVESVAVNDNIEDIKSKSVADSVTGQKDDISDAGRVESTLSKEINEIHSKNLLNTDGSEAGTPISDNLEKSFAPDRIAISVPDKEDIEHTKNKSEADSVRGQKDVGRVESVLSKEIHEIQLKNLSNTDLSETPVDNNLSKNLLEKTLRADKEEGLLGNLKEETKKTIGNIGSDPENGGLGDMNKKNNINVETEHLLEVDSSVLNKSEEHQSEDLTIYNEPDISSDPKERVLENLTETTKQVYKTADSATDIGNRSADIKSKMVDGENETVSKVDQVEPILDETHEEKDITKNNSSCLTKGLEINSIAEKTSLASDTVESDADKEMLIAKVAADDLPPKSLNQQEYNSLNSRKDTIVGNNGISLVATPDGSHDPKMFKELGNQDEPAADVLEAVSNNNKADEAATMIQKTWKGFHERNDLNKKTKNGFKDVEKPEDISTDQKLKRKSDAAVKIQSFWRGHVVRKMRDDSGNKYEQMKRQREESIIKIQAVVRGYLEKIKYEKLKARNRTVSNEAKELSESNITLAKTSDQTEDDIKDKNNDHSLEQILCENTKKESLQDRGIILDDENSERPTIKTENEGMPRSKRSTIDETNVTDNDNSTNTKETAESGEKEGGTRNVEFSKNIDHGIKESNTEKTEDNNSKITETKNDDSYDTIREKIPSNVEMDQHIEGKSDKELENSLSRSLDVHQVKTQNTNQETENSKLNELLIENNNTNEQSLHEKKIQEDIPNRQKPGDSTNHVKDNRNEELSKSIIDEVIIHKKLTNEEENDNNYINLNTPNDEEKNKQKDLIEHTETDNKEIEKHRNDKSSEDNSTQVKESIENANGNKNKIDDTSNRQTGKTASEDKAENGILKDYSTDIVENLETQIDDNNLTSTVNDNKNVVIDNNKEIAESIRDANEHKLSLNEKVKETYEKKENEENEALVNKVGNINNGVDMVKNEYMPSKTTVDDNRKREETNPIDPANLEDTSDGREDVNVPDEKAHTNMNDKSKDVIHNANMDRNVQENLKNKKTSRNEPATTQADDSSPAVQAINDVADPNIEDNSDFKERKSNDKEKPDFYRSDTVVEPIVVKKAISHLGDASKNSSIETQPINGNIELNVKDDNNNTQDKEETELEGEVRSAIDQIVKGHKNESSLEVEIKAAIKDIMENNVDTLKNFEEEKDENNDGQAINEAATIDMLPRIPSPDHIISKDIHNNSDHTVKKIEPEAQETLTAETKELDETKKDLDTSKLGEISSGHDQLVDQSIKNENSVILPVTPEYISDKKGLKSHTEPSSSETSADDVSSVESIDSVITVVPNVNYDASDEKEYVTSKQKVLPPNRSASQDVIKETDSEKVFNKNLVKKSLSTDALKGHVDLIDHVQNTLLDQISGKPVDTANKFDIEQLRKELHEAASLYKSEEEDPHFATHDDELLEYLNDFEPEEDNDYDSKIIRTPNRELPDIEEEVDSSNDDVETARKVGSHQETSEFCQTPSDVTTGAEKLIDNKPLKDHVEILNLEKLKHGHNEIIINNDNIEINRTKDMGTGGTDESNQHLLHTSELHDMVIPMGSSLTDRSSLGGSGKLKHTSEFHDTLVVPLPSGSDVNIKNEAKEMLGNGKLSEPKQTETMDNGNQTASQQSPAGAPIVTSRGSSQDGVAVAEAQASLRDTSPAKPKSVEPLTHQSPSQSPRFVKQAMERKNMEAEAATKIQAGFRGYQVRKQLKTKNSTTDRSNQDRHLVRRKSSGRKNMKDTDLAEKSAVKIQAGVRGFLVRRRQKKQLSSSASA